MSGFLGEALLAILLLTAVISVICMLSKSSVNRSDADPMAPDDRHKLPSGASRKSEQTRSLCNRVRANRKTQDQYKQSKLSN